MANCYYDVSDRAYFISVEQMLEKLSIHGTKHLLKLDEDNKVLGNSKSRHSCTKCGFYLVNLSVMFLRIHQSKKRR